MYLVHVRRLQDTSVFQTDLKMVFDCIRFSEDKERLYRTIQENEGYNQLDEDAYDVIARYTRIFGDKKIDVLEGGKVNMCKAMQELREDWKEEGRAEGRKVMINLDSTFKSRDITLPTKVRLVKAMVFRALLCQQRFV